MKLYEENLEQVRKNAHLFVIRAAQEQKSSDDLYYLSYPHFTDFVCRAIGGSNSELGEAVLTPLQSAENEGLRPGIGTRAYAIRLEILSAIEEAENFYKGDGDDIEIAWEKAVKYEMQRQEQAKIASEARAFAMMQAVAGWHHVRCA
jgi:hypothetical protein